jgi:parvulin-like peptidyl-prolyl isomerase
LAQQHSLDRLTGENGGDMGYFARGSLLVPELEPVAFALEPGAVSEVIAPGSVDGTQTVYYILQVIEKDAERPLPADMRTTMMQQVFQTWLDNLWQQAVIEKYVQ